MQKTFIDSKFYEYILNNSVYKNHPTLIKLKKYTQTINNSHMQISEDQGQFMSLLGLITNAKKYLEIGVFTGYSSLLMALTLGEDSIIYALDNKQNYIDIAKSFWQEANVEKQITALIDDAKISLEKLIYEHKETFDIAFIDANKNNYKYYYEYCLKLVKPKGIILIDNTLFHGEVLNKNSKIGNVISEFNNYIYNDNRVFISLIPIADGLTIAYKK